MPARITAKNVGVFYETQCRTELIATNVTGFYGPDAVQWARVARKDFAYEIAQEELSKCTS